jgi:CBS domain containing-hemolysin-like protein
LFVDILLVILFLGLSALFAAGEFAFFSVSRDDLERLNDRRARTALRMLAQPHELMIKLLIGSSVSNVLVAVFGLRSAWHAFPEGSARAIASVAALLVASILIATLARLLPRVYVGHNPETAAVRLARPVSALLVPIWPVVKGVALLTRGLSLAGIQAREALLKAGQLRAIARVGDGGESGEQDEREMINAIFEMRDTVVREVMVPRIDMLCAEATTTVGEAIKIIATGGHSRIPVYDKTVDNILGILHVRDLFKFLEEGGLDAPVGDVLRDAYFVPESKKVRDLLKELRRLKTHMAIVVDEFGGVVGLATLEDVLEEIVGEIYDEYDEEQMLVQVLGDHEVSVDGTVRIEDLNEAIRADITEDEDYDTIAGYLYNLLGRVPAEGDEYEAGGLSFVIQKVTGQRIERVLIRGQGLGSLARETAENSQ